MADAPQLIACTHEAHAQAILDILNEAILHSTAIYDYQARPLASMLPWFEAKRQHHHPVIGAIDASGELLGFATYGSFRAWPAYAHTAELSVYVRHDRRGQGLGSLLLQALVDEAQLRQVHVLMAVIDAANQASVGLHLKHGFEPCGHIRECGRKFGRWLDVVLYQRIFDDATPPAAQRES